MSVSVSLLELVRVPNTRPIWPEEFAALVSQLEETPDQKSQWGIIADWCDEHDEPELGIAFRWVPKRDGLSIELRAKGTWDEHWLWVGMPEVILSVNPEPTGDCRSIPGKVAVLALRLRKLKEMLL